MEFKDIQEQLKAGKSKEELAKTWTHALQDWKSSQKNRSVKQQAQWELQIKDLSAKLASREEELQKSAALLAQVRSEMTKKDQEFSRSTQDLQRVRQEFLTRAVDIEKLTAELESAKKQLSLTQENFLSKDRDLTLQSGKSRELETSLAQTLTNSQELLRKLEQREEEIERLKGTLNRYEGGELERTWVHQLGALEVKLSEANSQLQAKEKELADFQEFLRTKEEAIAKAQEEQAYQASGEREKYARENEKLTEELKARAERAAELDRELTSFRRLLRREEERSKVLEEQNQMLERVRRDLQDKLASLGVEMRDYSNKIARYFGGSVATAQSDASAAVSSSVPFAGFRAPAGRPEDASVLAFPSASAESASAPSIAQDLEESNLEEEILKLEPGGDLDIDFDIPSGESEI